MLTKDGVAFVAECDFCSETLDMMETEWNDAIERMKREHWRISQQLGEWFHRCPSCQDGPSADDFSEV